MGRLRGECQRLAQQAYYQLFQEEMKTGAWRKGLWKTNQATGRLLQGWGTRCTPSLGGQNAPSLQPEMGLLRMELEALGHGDTGRPRGTLKWLAGWQFLTFTPHVPGTEIVVKITMQFRFLEQRTLQLNIIWNLLWLDLGEKKENPRLRGGSCYLKESLIKPFWR